MVSIIFIINVGVNLNYMFLFIPAISFVTDT